MYCTDHNSCHGLLAVALFFISIEGLQDAPAHGTLARIDLGALGAFAAPSKVNRKVNRLMKESQRAMQRGDHEAVEHMLGIALSLDPTRADVAFGHAIALSFLQDNDGARRDRPHC